MVGVGLFWSSVRPSIFGVLTVESCVLFICNVSVVLYSAGSGVQSVVVVLPALSVCWLCLVHSCICCIYCCTCCCAVCGFWCDVSIVMSSAYVMDCTCGGERGRSAMYILSGTPVFMLRREDLLLL